MCTCRCCEGNLDADRIESHFYRSESPLTQAMASQDPTCCTGDHASRLELRHFSQAVPCPSLEASWADFQNVIAPGT